jgi:hypothetical protein
MSTFKSSTMVLLYPKGGFTLPSALSAFHSAERLDCQGARVQQQAKVPHDRFQANFRRCWWKMRIMNAAFGLRRSNDDAQPQKRNEEHLLDEQAWSRMDDEGCPNGRQLPHLHREIIQARTPTSMKRRLMPMLHELFVVPHPGGISSICFACITKYVALRCAPKEGI